jgi:Uma2 family endonuclease
MEINEPMVLYGKKTFTVQEYLEFERSSSEKHEFYKGEIFRMHGHGELLAMSGASRKHNTIFANLIGAMVSQLKGKSCQPFGPGMRVNIPENTLYTYPDISVFCGEAESSLQDEDTIIKPTVLVEIISPSTRNYDQGEKFKLYRDIPSLREYVVADTETVRIDTYRINNKGHWELEEYKSLTDQLSLPSIQVIIPVADIYEKTKLSKTAP